MCGGNLPWFIRLVLSMEIVAFSQNLSFSLRVLTSALNSSLLTHWLFPLAACLLQRETNIVTLSTRCTPTAVDTFTDTSILKL